MGECPLFQLQLDELSWNTLNLTNGLIHTVRAPNSVKLRNVHMQCGSIVLLQRMEPAIILPVDSLRSSVVTCEFRHSRMHIY